MGSARLLRARERNGNALRPTTIRNEARWLDALQEAIGIRRHQQAFARSIDREFGIAIHEFVDGLPGTRARHARKRIAIDDAILNDHVASDIDERGVSAQFLQNVVAVVGGVQDHQDLLALHAARDLRDDLRTGRTAEQKVDLTSRDPSLGPGRALVLDCSPSARFGLDGPLG